MTQRFFTILLLLLFLVGCREKKADAQENSPKDIAQLGDSMVVQPLSYEERQGMHLYKKYCMVCHGESGRGDGFNAFNLDPRPRNFTDVRYMSSLNNERLLETISQGGRGVNKSLFMPSWGHRLNTNEIEYIITYIRYLAKEGQQQP